MSTIHNINGDLAAGSAVLQPADYVPVYVAADGVSKKLTGAQIAGAAPGVVAATAATLTVTQAAHAGRIVTLDRAAGITCTMPAATGTGSKYTFIVVTTISSNAHVFNRAGSDTFAGYCLADDGDGEPANGFSTVAATAVTLGGTSNATGGLKGDKVEFTDVASGLWHVAVNGTQGGTEATPFS
jgi:hypothetical protein